VVRSGAARNRFRRQRRPVFTRQGTDSSLVEVLREMKGHPAAAGRAQTTDEAECSGAANADAAWLPAGAARPPTLTGRGGWRDLALFGAFPD